MSFFKKAFQPVWCHAGFQVSGWYANFGKWIQGEFPIYIGEVAGGCAVRLRHQGRALWRRPQVANEGGGRATLLEEGEEGV